MSNYPRFCPTYFSAALVFRSQVTHEATNSILACNFDPFSPSTTNVLPFALRAARGERSERKRVVFAWVMEKPVERFILMVSTFLGDIMGVDQSQLLGMVSVESLENDFRVHDG
ncbi:hypothetical protein N7G274_003898 [Stereocaulon virgatum]|uniref:Uncharacterized protein n=1 Tax=Stereocaulon virgatum TaxID=373712 RepID=A0ABR4AFG8_9LECA